MAWYLAPSLTVLRAEINARWPGRDKASDGTIGDAAHQASRSDHNPNSRGSVNAIDIDEDGIDVAEVLAAIKRHPSARYIIYERRLYHRDRGWRPEPYWGSNPHTAHFHLSIDQTREAEQDIRPWGIARVGMPSVPSTGSVPAPTLREGDEGSSVEVLQRALNEALDLDLAEDGDFGPNTTSGVKALQRRAGIEEDGIYGPASADALRDLLEDDMDLTDKLDVTTYTTNTWGRRSLDVETALSHGYTYSRAASDRAAKLLEESAKQTALLKQTLAAASGISEESITAAVAEGVRQAINPAELAQAVAEAVDHDLDTAAVEAALRSVLGGVDEHTA